MKELIDVSSRTKETSDQLKRVRFMFLQLVSKTFLQNLGLMAQSTLIPSPALNNEKTELQQTQPTQLQNQNSDVLNYLTETQLTSFEITWQRFIEVFGAYFSVADKNEVSFIEIYYFDLTFFLFYFFDLF